MKIRFVPTTLAIACLASSSEARIGESRNLVGTNAVEDVLLETTRAGAKDVVKINLREGDLKVDEQDTTEPVNQELSKPLPSFDQAMHVDAPKHGKYVRERPGRMDSFCARHNHFGPDCKQHRASLRGKMGRNKEVSTHATGAEEPKSYLQEHVHEAQHNRDSRSQTRQDHQRQSHGGNRTILAVSHKRKLYRHRY